MSPGDEGRRFLFGEIIKNKGIKEKEYTYMIFAPHIPIQGFFLGLSSGTVCLFSCAPVLTPYFLGEGKKTGGNFLSLIRFMMGRLLGYLLFGIIAWESGQTLLKFLPQREIFFGVVFIILSLFLAAYGLFDFRIPCAADAAAKSSALKFIRSGSALFPALLGFLTGINICPPFLMALADSSNTATLLGSVAFFFMFFLGTLPFFLPMPFLGLLTRFPQVRMVGKMTAVLMGAYYFYLGMMKCIGGMKIQ
ncbi:MAG: sulfite exporter TauE/SafE family protein [bacterium]